MWVRAPVQGHEYYTGLTRSKLYELDGAGKIRSVSIREKGAVKGCRLFDLSSILDYIQNLADVAELERASAAATRVQNANGGGDN